VQGSVTEDDDDEPDTDTDDEPEPSPISSGFISEPDGGIESYECSLYDQDCDSGEKCNVWANDGGSAWNATKCVAVDPDPDQVGETCQVEGSGVSGIDSCALGAFCWDVDPEVGLGMCVSYCQGTAEAPTCANPREYPAAGKEFCICLERCDPLLNDCPVGCGCYGIDRRFQCVPDASGPDAGAFGDPCEFTNGCDPGLSCTNGEMMECDTSACCSLFCDLSQPDPCPDGHSCSTIYPDGGVPPGNEDIGICLLP
jgi:hypothetical protein